MIKLEVLLYVAIGMATMLIPILIQVRWLKMKGWKGIAVALSGTVAGTIGTMVMYFIENQKFGGISFYGAVFAVPTIMLVMSGFLKEPYERIMDLCGPAAGAMQCVMKVSCVRSGCCGGRFIYGEISFPSQIVESLNGFVIMLVLLAMAKKKPGRGDLYPWFLVIYGCTRFLLNLMRGSRTAFLLGLPAGNFWSVICVAWGLVWLYRLRKNKQ